MRAGQLDTPITVERVATTVNVFGVPSETWTAIASLRAEVIQATTEEFMRGFGASSEAVIVFRTRWLALTLADRIVYAERPHRIVEVKEIGRRRGLEIRCTATGA